MQLALGLGDVQAQSATTIARIDCMSLFVARQSSRLRNKRACFTGGSQSERGNQFAANLNSVIHTCRKQHRDVLAYLNSAIHAALHDRKTPSLIAAR